MKKSFLLFSIIAILFSINTFAQKFEGKIEYEISYDDLDEEMKAYEAMLPKEMNFLVKNHRSKMTQPNAMGGETVVLLDQNTKKSTVLVDMMGNKIALDNDQSDTEEEKPNISYVDETKTIAGYTSKKAVVTDDMGNKTTIWYTEDIPALDLNLGVDGLKGFPMEFESEQNGITAKITAKKVNKLTVSDSEFEIPGDYKKMTQQEFQQMMQQGQ